MLKKISESYKIWEPLWKEPYIQKRYGAKKNTVFFNLIISAIFQWLAIRTRGKSSFYADLPYKFKSFYSGQKIEVIARSFFKGQKHGIFLDVGCAWPFKFSNTAYLEKHLSWSGIAVDAKPRKKDRWRRHRPRSRVFSFIVTDCYDTTEKFYLAGPLGSTQATRIVNKKIIQGREVELPTITLSKLLDDLKVEKVDFLSMDIEQSEPAALRGFDIDRFQPALVCIERSKNNQKQIFDYFMHHHYQLIDEYLYVDGFNWYFKPKGKNSE